MGTPRKRKPPYTKVWRSIWNSHRFRSLSDIWAQQLFFFYLTCPQQGPTGCFHMPDEVALSYLKRFGWSLERYREKQGELAEKGLIRRDSETEEIQVIGWWKHARPNNEKWIKGCRSQCESIASDELRDSVFEELEEHERNWLQESRAAPPVKDHHLLASDGAENVLRALNGGRH